MPNSPRKKEKPDVYVVSGPITMGSALAVLNEGRAIIDGGENDFSLANLEGSDSAAIAVLLSWQRRAAKSSRGLHFYNSPAQLVAIAALYGVTGYLSGFPLDDTIHTGAQPLA
jgi:phospholipid transport system transporter-binding protein